MDYEIRVFGTPDCPDTARTRMRLDELGVQYQFINIDNVPQARHDVENWNGGKALKPTLEITASGESRRLAEPTNEELEQVLRESRILAEGVPPTRRKGDRGEAA